MRRTLLTVLIVFVISAIATGQTQPAPEKTWGLCIGIAQYDSDDLTLKWSDKDATEFSTFLRYGLRLPETHYRILRNRDATRENILESLGWLNMVANPGDRVYIFYSGHGKENSPFLPHDSYNLLSLQSIKKALHKIEAQDVIVFADACHSGKLAGKGVKATVNRKHLTGLSKGVVFEMGKARADLVIMTSARGIQKAYEWEGQKNGIFTYYLMKALMDRSQHSMIDQERNGELTLYEVYKYIYRAVTTVSEQEPQISDPKKAKEIVLLSYSVPTLTPTAAPIPTPISTVIPVPTHDMAVLVVDDRNAISWDLSHKIVAILQSQGIGVTTPFAEAFVSEGSFEKIFNGNPDEVNKVELFRHGKHVLLGKKSVSFVDNPELQGMITANVSVTIHVVSSMTGAIEASFTIAQNGPGFNKTDAEKVAIERISQELEERIVTIIKEL